MIASVNVQEEMTQKLYKNIARDIMEHIREHLPSDATIKLMGMDTVGEEDAPCDNAFYLWIKCSRGVDISWLDPSPQFYPPYKVYEIHNKYYEDNTSIYVCCRNLHLGEVTYYYE